MKLPLIKQLCSMDTETLKTVIKNFLKDKGYNVIENDLFLIAEGELPICLIAHMDTVFPGPPAQFYFDSKEKVLWSPHGAGFDDRAGLYAIVDILEHTNLRPSIVLLDLEERGGEGAQSLVTRYSKCPFKDCRALVELDRANYNDSVFYSCDNKKFEDYINKFGFETAIGTFSDISIIAPVWKIAAVNLSIGYLDEHSYVERLQIDWCDEIIEKVKNILIESNSMPHFKYIEKNRKRIFFGDNKTCLFCGKQVKNYYTVKDKEYDYIVCDDCYSKCF